MGTALPDNTRDAAWEGAWWKAAASFLGSPAVRPGKLLCPCSPSVKCQRAAAGFRAEAAPGGQSERAGSSGSCHPVRGCLPLCPRAPLSPGPPRSQSRQRDLAGPRGPSQCSLVRAGPQAQECVPSSAGGGSPPDEGCGVWPACPEQGQHGNLEGQTVLCSQRGGLKKSTTTWGSQGFKFKWLRPAPVPWRLKHPPLSSKQSAPPLHRSYRGSDPLQRDPEADVSGMLPADP